MNYANLYLYSDVRPYEIVRRVSDKTIEVRELDAELNADWTPEIVSGGFSGHCTNQNSQQWTFRSNPDAPVVRVRLRKDGQWHSAYGRHVIQPEPRRFYDFNF